jgi:carbonic anhydrase
MNCRILKAFAVALALMAPTFSSVSSFGAETKADPASRLLRDASLMLLREGNTRYISGKSQHPNLDAERRSSTVAQGQEPIATILACSDSLEPVELIFDRGIGDLFVVRVAGNVAGGSELASVEYGVGHLNTPLLIVMGHTRCGAVTAVVKGTELHGNLRALADRIKPAAEKVLAETPDTDEAIPKAIQANVWQTIEDVLKQSRDVRTRVSAGKAHVQGALYDLESGKVTWLGSHPTESAIIALAEQAETDAALSRKLAAANPSPASVTPQPGVKSPASVPAQEHSHAAGHDHSSHPPAKTAPPKSH